MFIGTPNRHRVIGNVGSYGKGVGHKVRQNARDWKMRVKGTFRNEEGAHAGFAQRELESMLVKHFRATRWVTREYLLFKYSSGAGRIAARALTTVGIREIAVPSIYALCRK